MSMTLYDATVLNFMQAVGAVSGFLDKGLGHLKENNVDPADIVEARFAADMLPFRFQIVSVAHHSRGAIEAVKNGVFSPWGRDSTLDYAGLQGLMHETGEYLAKLTRDEVNGLVGRKLVFAVGDRKIPYVAEDFLLSFSQPNFYFHAATAYDILRWKGVPVGKRDFMGRVRTAA